MPTRTLSFDEQQAAEAAFHGHPLQPQWGARAKQVYTGIAEAKQKQSLPHYQWRIGLQRPTEIQHGVYPTTMSLHEIIKEISHQFPNRPFSLLRAKLMSPAKSLPHHHSIASLGRF